MKTINDYIVQTAIKYIGMKEISGNQGWEDKDFQERMETIGWMYGWAWCSLFFELIWKEAYVKAGHSPMVGVLNKLCSASVMKTYQNFQDSSLFVVDHIPEVGAGLAFQKYKDGKPTNFGHFAIIEVAEPSSVETIEGNTNAKGSREGDTSARKHRLLDFSPRENGLVPVGVIHPIQLEVL